MEADREEYEEELQQLLSEIDEPGDPLLDTGLHQIPEFHSYVGLISKQIIFLG